ncbi:hypothetical protein ONS96_001908 [Cadophora gregata f. sp. sojae]|nr:hypothetical protein ONS96_001908 [Cadophora gregata f. sp. sojae]
MPPISQSQFQPQETQPGVLEIADISNMDSTGQQQIPTPTPVPKPKSNPNPKPRLYLEPLDPAKHLEAFHEIWTFEEALRWFPFPVKKNVSESREFLERILPNEENPDIEKFALMLLPASGSETEQSQAQTTVFIETEKCQNAEDGSRGDGESQLEEGNTGKGEDGEGKEKGNRERNERGDRKEKAGEMVGFVGTNRYKEQGMEVGYVIHRRYWGRGFATEGLKLFLEMYWGLEGMFFPHCSSVLNQSEHVSEIKGKA